MADSFFTDGMTVDDILHLDLQTINSLNKRDLSRALRTVSLAANKRVKRLKDNKKDIAEDALNWLSDQGYSRKKFGSKNKSLNQMRKEFFTAKQFMGMKTSKVRGAIQVKEGRESRIMGETKKQAVSKGRHDFVYRYQQEHGGRAPSMKAIKAEIKRLEEQYTQMSSDAWSIYRKMLEAQGWPNSPYKNYYNSENIIEMIGERVAAGEDSESILSHAINAFNESYEDEQEELNKIEDDDGLDMTW